MSWKIAVYGVNSLSHFGSHYLLAGSGFLFSSPSCVPWERFLTQPPVICFTLLRNSVCLDFGWSGAAKTLVALKEDLKTVTSSARLRQMDIWSFPCLFFFLTWGCHSKNVLFHLYLCESLSSCFLYFTSFLTICVYKDLVFVLVPEWWFKNSPKKMEAERRTMFVGISVTTLFVALFWQEA